MLKRVAVMGTGWLVMSLLAAAVVVPLAADPAEAARLKLRPGANGSERADSTPAAPAELPKVKKPVESEPAQPVRLLNAGDERARAAAERAERQLIDSGEKQPNAASAPDKVPTAEPAAGKATVAAPVSPARRDTPVTTVATAKPKPLANGVICVAGC